jgi:hypothetical protein
LLKWQKYAINTFLQVQKIPANDGSKEKINLLATFDGNSFVKFSKKVTEPRFPYQEGSSDLAKCRAALSEYLSSVRTEVRYNDETEMHCEILKNLIHHSRDHEDLEWIDKHSSSKFCLIEASLAAKLVKRDADGNRYFTMDFTEAHSKLFNEFGSLNSFSMWKQVNNKTLLKRMETQYSIYNPRLALFVKANATQDGNRRRIPG